MFILHNTGLYTIIKHKEQEETDKDQWELTKPTQNSQLGL